jgi:serine/threonine protein kinase/formylglycine-generating enzyme required for sulfatase activity
LLCYRCGSHVPDGSEACGACGQKFSSGNLRQATGTFSRRKLASMAVEGAPFRPGEVLCDRYVVKDAVGAGPLGFVFKAQDKEIDVEIAIKVISPKLVQTVEERRAFSREIRLARKPAHNNLIRVYEDGEASDRPFYTMQYLDGLTLRRIIDLRKEKNQFFSLKEIEPIFAQIASGLDSVHKVVVHANLKPENVVVLPDLLKITDLGVGTAIPRQPFVAAQKARGGNAHRYLAPEFVSGQEIDKRADIFSLGVLLGEMLANTFPDGSSTEELRSRNPELPPPVENLYRRATNDNPLSRHATVAEFWAELEGIIGKAARPAPQPRRQTGSRPASSEPSFEIRAEDTNTPTPSPAPSSRRSQPPPAEPRARDSQRQPPMPPPSSGEDPAFNTPAIPQRPNGQIAVSETAETAETAEPTEVLNVQPAPRRARRFTPPPVPRRSGAGPLVWLAILGVVAGVGGGYVYLTYIRQPHSVTDNPNPNNPPLALAVDAAAPDQSAEERKLEEERKAAEARRIEEERKAAEARRIEDEKKAADAKRLEDERLAEQRRLDEEKKRRDALNKAFPKQPDTVAVVQPKQPGCPAGMKLIPAGSFRMGSAADDPLRGFDEKGLAPTEVAAYCIDFYEFPNKAGAMPTTRVNFPAAEAACKARSRRLCTEEEWERACKGPGSASFPYGATFDPEICNTQDANGEVRTVAASGTFQKCRSAFGIADMSGNVAEWTSSHFGSEAGDRTIKGGAADRPDSDCRCAARKIGSVGAANDRLGFRCCSDAN